MLSTIPDTEDEIGDETEPTRSLSDDLDCLTLKEARALYLGMALLAPAPVGCAAHDSIDGLAQTFRELFDHLR